MTTEEEGSKKKETLIKWGIVLAIAFAVAPYIYIAIGGMIGLAVAGVVGFTIIQLAPVVAMKIANRKIKMITDEAQQNPIETMKNLRLDREKELDIKHQEIIDFETEVRNFADQVVDFERKYPLEAPVYAAISKSMSQGLEDMKAKQEQAEKDLVVLMDAIEKAEAIYKMAQAAERVTKLSNSVEQMVFADIKQKVAFDSVRSQVNRSFAALNNSVGQRRELRSQATLSLPGVGADKVEVAS